MAEYPGFTIWTDAYMGDTKHLTTLEHGAYFLLLLTMWRAGGSLPCDDKKLARYSGLTVGQWGRIKETIMDFFTEENGVLTQSRLTRELEFVRQRSERQSRNAKAKSLKDNEQDKATAEPRHSHSPAPTPTPTLTEDTSLRSVAPQAASKRNRGTRLSADWVLPMTFGNWALEQGLPRERILIEANKMRDWSINAGAKGAKIDWFAAWRNWVQKAIDELPATKAANGFQKPAKGVTALADRIRRDIENGSGQDGQRGTDREDVQRLPFFAERH